MNRENVVLAIAAEKVQRRKRPADPDTREVPIDHAARVLRAQRAFDAGEAVFDVQVVAELAGEFQGTAGLVVEAVLESDLTMVAVRAIGTLCNGITEQIAQQQVAGDAAPSPQ